MAMMTEQKNDPDVLLFSRSNSPTLPVSAEVAERSRKNLTILLQKLTATGQVRVAEAMGVNESTISRMKDGDFERMAKMLAVLGLKAVPVEYQCMDMEQMNAIFLLAKARINSMDSASQLTFGD